MIIEFIFLLIVIIKKKIKDWVNTNIIIEVIENELKVISWLTEIKCPFNADIDSIINEINIKKWLIITNVHIIKTNILDWLIKTTLNLNNKF